jgi:hypothetical protein
VKNPVCALLLLVASLGVPVFEPVLEDVALAATTEELDPSGETTAIVVLG